jgi:hypothetical protein
MSPSAFRFLLMTCLAATLAASSLACSSSSVAVAPIEDAAADSATGDDATLDATLDTAADAPSDTTKAAACVDAFGESLPNGYGRLDGTVIAVLAPGEQCPMPNNDHVIVEVMASGAVYRVVVNVLSTSADPDVRFGTLDHALPAPAWADGFHTGVTLDYVTDLGLHAGVAPFAVTPMATLAPLVVSKIDVGTKITAFAQGTTGTSVHNVHRYGGGKDGALVLDPTGPNPHWLVFHFQNQSF